jgi:hypothetical protein
MDSLGNLAKQLALPVPVKPASSMPDESYVDPGQLITPGESYTGPILEQSPPGGPNERVPGMRTPVRPQRL